MAVKEHSIDLVVEEDAVCSRIDTWISLHVPDFPRSLASNPKTVFLIDGKEVKKSKMVKTGNLITVRWIEELFDSAEGQDIPLNIIYEDESLLVINKQQSLVVHPGAGNWNHTLVNALVFRYGDEFFSPDSEENLNESDEHGINTLRPGIVHRLDKDTSGVMVIAKNRKTHADLSKQFKDRVTTKYYIAIVSGVLTKRRGCIETTLVRDRKDRKKFSVGGEKEGKQAKTEYVVLRQYPEFAFVRIRLYTGRTHQIRVHMAHIGCPIIGDVLYNNRRKKHPQETLLLHAFTLEFFHPETKEKMRFRAPLPRRFSDFIRSVKNQFAT